MWLLSARSNVVAPPAPSTVHVPIRKESLESLSESAACNFLPLLCLSFAKPNLGNHVDGHGSVTGASTKRRIFMVSMRTRLLLLTLVTLSALPLFAAPAAGLPPLIDR